MPEDGFSPIRFSGFVSHFESTLNALLGALPGKFCRKQIITAVSGGPDSMCLAVLAHDHAARHGLSHRSVIIDHGIRPDSAAEAARVRARLHALGIAAEVLSVAGQAPATGIQEWARDVRYRLLLEQARREQAALLLGHHQDDQAETVAMRLRRGSGLAGLAGMRALRFREGVPVLRPMLGLRAKAVLEYAAARGLEFETDPSNRNRRFERVRTRQWLSKSEPCVHRDICRLSETAGRIDDALLAALARHRLLPSPQAAGHAWLAAAAIQLPGDVSARLLGHVITQITAAAHPPTRDALARLVGRLRMARPSTLGGARFTAHEDGWLVTAEEGRRPGRAPIAAGGQILFAGRWRVSSPVDATVRRLGAAGSGARAGWRQSDGWCGLPPLVRRSLPVLETLDGTLYYPHLVCEGTRHGRSGEALAEFLPHSLDRLHHQAASKLNGMAAGTAMFGAPQPV